MTAHALLFTDLVDSTAIVERLGDARAASMLAEHDRSARALLAVHGGREIDHSDGFFLLFDEAVQAASFALAYHDALAALGLRARAGLHVGRVTLRENDPREVARGAKAVEVEGIAKPLAARVMSLARGGQILLTHAAGAALGDGLADVAAIESHGHYRLKGIAEPVEIFELGVRDRSSFAPPGDSEKALRVVRADGEWRPVRDVRHNLPRERDAFVGRASDLAAIASRLDGGARLLTVLGPGGTGKTRLARRYGWSWLGDWPGGVYFCDLSETRTLEGVFFVVALALEVPLGKSDPGVQLGHAIATRGRCLVILDNFEQIVGHAEASGGRPTPRSWSRAASGCASPARKCCRSSRYRSPPRESSCSHCVLARSDPNSRSRRRIAPAFSASSLCSTGCRSQSSWRRHGSGSCRPPNWSSGSPTASACLPGHAALPIARRPSEARSTGPGTCCRHGNRRRSRNAPCSKAASRSTPPKP
jgi:class 3 adenylate cyclase